MKNSRSQIFKGSLRVGIKAKPLYDWINSAVAHPYIIAADEKLCTAIVSQGITNPIHLAKYLLKENALEQLSPRLFYKYVLKNLKVSNATLFEDVVCILKVSKNKELSLRKIDSLLVRYMMSYKYKLFIQKCFNCDCCINPFWSDTRILKEEVFISAQRISYKGNLILPSVASLINLESDLIKEGRKMHHCIAIYWPCVEDRECFVIKVRGEQAGTCLIERNKYMSWFEIREFLGESNAKMPQAMVAELALYIAKPHNQLFFYNNYALLNEEELYSKKSVNSIFLGLQGQKNFYNNMMTENVIPKKLNFTLQCTSQQKVCQGEESIQPTAQAAWLSLRGDTLMFEMSSVDFLSQVDIYALLGLQRKVYTEKLKKQHKRKMVDIEDFFYNIQEKRIKECFKKLYEGDNLPLVDYSYDNLDHLLLECNESFDNQDKASEFNSLKIIDNEDVIVEFLEEKGYYVKRTSNSSQHNIKQFLCKRLGVGELCDDDTLLATLKSNLKEPVFPQY